MSDDSISPYAPARPPKPLRSFKSDPYKHLFSKWSITKWVTYFLCAYIFVWAVTDSDRISMIEKLFFLPIIGVYYYIYLYDAREMEKTFTRWGFKFDALKIPYLKQSKHIRVKFRMNNSELEELLPLREILIIKPGVITLLKYKGNRYGVMWRGYPKKNEDDNLRELELRVKKFLDGLQENLVFKSIWYTIENPKQEARKTLETTSNEGEYTKARDIHLQGLISYVDADDRAQVVGKYVYFMDLGICENKNKAIMQFNAIVPGLEQILKPALSSIQRVTNPIEVYGIFDEIWGVKEVTE
jgi:hypothetical protein